ncbi:MAG: double-strand break repair helicase AddA, partial [Paracoccaceae bacterium]
MSEIRRDDATERQVRAADPTATTWLSANAGSGKTRVLTDRVARLLLNGVEPQHILCLTYTKAAATEMQNRLFRRLGQWAMKPDPDLRADLLALGETGLTHDHLAQARRLFARAIETPGGLRIQTIHSFCATLLRRFPLEAGVSPQFMELDDRAARILREEIVEELALTRPDVMADLARPYTGEDFAGLMEEVGGHASRFVAPLDLAAARALFGASAADGIPAVLADVFLGGEAEWLAAMQPVLLSGGATDQKLAAALSALPLAAPDADTLAAMEGLFLTGAKAKEPFTAKIGSLPTKATRAALDPVALDRLENLMRRVELARPRRLALMAAEKTAVLHRFAAAFLPLYAARKAARGWLDFDDLIQRAKALLTDPSVAAWVLFRLDGGIDHILVDEAQDTSPDQWRVIELLAAEFTAGQGAQENPRTLFVVGDKKQSIYSFQGADVAAFDAKQAMFQSRFTQAELTFRTEKLEHSFRSSPAILSLVDATFGDRFPRALGEGIAHIAHKSALPGRVDLWPLIEKADKAEDEDWENPVDLITDSHHAARLAEAVAREIRTMIDDGVRIVDEGISRPCHAGDFLILVQRRSTVFAEIIDACKKAGLPIAGADRLKLGAELAVKDIAALLSFLALPEDDLSLATVLRSPLCGWTEGELYDLAQPRPGYLWQALRADARWPETRAMLNDLRDRADYLRPFELIERALTRWDGRRRLIARLGAEAEDGIDELLSQALSYERSEVPSLTGFLTRLQTDDVDVKRQMESGGRRIRVMTVHGAKGLEAPIVILPDTADRKPRDNDEVHVLDGGAAVWKVAAEDAPPALAQARGRRAERTADENLRLLYVALTRARCWLIVCGAGEARTDAAWHSLVAAGMAAVGAQPGPAGRLR